MNERSRSTPFATKTIVFLSLIVAIGLALRLDFLRAANFTIDADEAIVGIMARDILAGRGVPVFYYGQHYMGSLEAILASVSFYLFGASSFSLQLVPLMFSLIVIVLAYLLTSSLSNSRAGLFAALLTALPPPALVVWSYKARGGFIEVLAIGGLAMWLTARWLQRDPNLLRYPAAIGFLLGVGWWVNNQILYFMAPIGVFCIAHTFSLAMRLAPLFDKHARLRGRTLNFSGYVLSIAKISAVGLVSFFVGGSAYWWYNIALDFPSVGMFKVAGWKGFWEHIKGLFATALPAIFGAQRFWQRDPIFPYAKHVVLILYAIPLFALIISRRRKLCDVAFGRIDRSAPIELLIFFCAFSCFIFAVSSFGSLVQAPRYLLPLYIGIFPLVAVCCDLVYKRSRGLGLAYLALLLAFQISASYIGGRAIGGEPFVFGGQRVARNHRPVIEALDRLGINHIRANYWIGYRLAFESEERITFTVFGEPTQARIARYEEPSLEKRELLPLLLVQAEYFVVKPALARSGFTFKDARVGDYYLLYQLGREFKEQDLLDIRSVGFSARASGKNPPEGALDGDLKTRWGTGAPQTPGQSFEVELAQAVSISGIRYHYGEWFNDRPVELKVEIEDSRGVNRVVLSRRESPGILHLSSREPFFTLRFSPILAKRIVFTQLGNHPILDWSIAELELLRDRQ
jgi:hypothetical protein